MSRLFGGRGGELCVNYCVIYKHRSKGSFNVMGKQLTMVY